MILDSSFRDPDGFVFEYNEKIYRQVNKSFKLDFDCFINSGLYDELVEKKYLLPHTDVTQSEVPRTSQAYKILLPLQLPFISYPYEWCFKQLKDAAILTLQVQNIALKYGLTLKDASAFNIQFLNGNPIFIDTLSFERYQEGGGWVAYRQFCEHFLAPLSLASYKDIELLKLLTVYIDGIPLALTSKLLPAKTYLKYGLLTHIHFHSIMQDKYADIKKDNKKRVISQKLKKSTISKQALTAIIHSLQSLVNKLIWKSNTEWGNYYQHTNYIDSALNHKQDVVKGLLKKIGFRGKIVFDLGANDGMFSRIVAEFSDLVVSWDVDYLAVQKNYEFVKSNSVDNILPLVQDFACPSPAIGWSNKERLSFFDRKKSDLTLALALIHHLVIGKNIPFERIAKFFSSISNLLIIEFVPRSDSQVKKLLFNRKDIFENYNQKNFECVFKKFFQILEIKKVKESKRIIYFMSRLN